MTLGEAILTFDAIERRALKMWREREMTFPARVRRLSPDDFDHASGAWERMLAEAARELGVVR